MELPPPAPAPNRQPVRRIAFTGLALLAIVLLFIVLAPDSSHRRITWLTPAQIKDITRPGPLTRFKYKLLNWVGPLYRWYMKDRPLLHVSTSFFPLPADFGNPTGLGAPVSTNADGQQAWIVPAAALAAIREQLMTPDMKIGIAPVGGPTVMVFSGTQAQVQVTQSVRVRGNIPPGGVAATNFVSAGLVVDLIPTAHAGSINLLVAATKTEFANPPALNDFAIKTNFFGACRVTITNAGALILHSGPTAGNGGSNYWVIISPVLTDATGKPLKR